LDVTEHPRNMWLIDFTGLTLEEAMCYEKPFKYIVDNVKPFREVSRQQVLKNHWWLFERSRPEMREAIDSLKRFIVTPLTSKYRLYIWVTHPTLPDQANYVFARDDDYFFGILQSYLHELWVRRKGTQLREAASGSRYSPTETFMTFPFPWPLGKEPKEYDDSCVKKVAELSRRLDTFRNNLLNPDELTKSNVGEITLGKRTLTYLYNALEHYRGFFKGKSHNTKEWELFSKKVIRLDEIEELDQIHNELNHAVFDCYGWGYFLTDEEILDRLLILNQERAKA